MTDLIAALAPVAAAGLLIAARLAWLGRRHRREDHAAAQQAAGEAYLLWLEDQFASEGEVRQS
jgi:uncharacterized membrane protein SpoIIM required for sporulation